MTEQHITKEEEIASFKLVINDLNNQIKYIISNKEEILKQKLEEIDNNIKKTKFKDTKKRLKNYKKHITDNLDHFITEETSKLKLQIEHIEKKIKNG